MVSETYLSLYEVSRYTEIQIAGMKYLYNNYNVRIKCGWTNSGNKAMDSISVADVDTLINGRRMNEFFFDTLYRFVFPQDNFSFVYIDCGRDISNGNGVVPYTVDSYQVRPILNGSSIEVFVNGIPNSKAKSSIIKNWGCIIALFEELFFVIPINTSCNPEELILKKLDYIQKEVLFRLEQ